MWIPIVCRLWTKRPRRLLEMDKAEHAVDAGSAWASCVNVDTVYTLREPAHAAFTVQPNPAREATKVHSPTEPGSHPLRRRD